MKVRPANGANSSSSSSSSNSSSGYGYGYGYGYGSAMDPMLITPDAAIAAGILRSAARGNDQDVKDCGMILLQLFDTGKENQ